MSIESEAAQRDPANGPLALPIAPAHNRNMPERIELQSVSLEPDPVIEFYKKDVDRTLIRENLKLTPAERIARMISVLRFADELRRSGTAAR